MFVRELLFNLFSKIALCIHAGSHNTYIIVLEEIGIYLVTIKKYFLIMGGRFCPNLKNKHCVCIS